MGHYDDIIEAREQVEHEARAKRLGITPEQLVEKDRHEDKMQRGRVLADRRQADDELIEYYLKHKEP